MTRRGTARVSLGKPDYETLAEFRYLLRNFVAFSDAAAEEAGLRPQQHQALLVIKGFPGRERITIGELAERLGIRHHSAVGLVDRLVGHGLVRRHAERADRRQVTVALTPEAEALLARLSLAHRDALTRLAPLFQELLAQLAVPPPSADRKRHQSP